MSVPDPICALDFLTMEFPPRGFLLRPWLPEKGLTMIAGPRGAGKTHLALGVAHAVASGGEFLGWSASTQRRTLYIDGEMPAVSLQDRLARIVEQTPSKLHPGALSFLAADQSEFGLPDLSTLDGQAALRPLLDPYELVVFDNLSTLFRSGRENDAESWALAQSFVLLLRRANKSVVLVHHTGKTGAQRGTSKREDVLDSVLLLKRPHDYDPSQGVRFIVEYDKARGFHGDDAAPFEAALDPVAGVWSINSIAESRDGQVRELHEQGLSVRDIADELGMSKSAAGRIVKNLRTRKNAHAS